MTTQRLKDIRSAEEAYLEWTKVEEGIEEGYYLEILTVWCCGFKHHVSKVPYDVGTDHTLDSLSQDSIDFYTIDKTRFPFCRGIENDGGLVVCAHLHGQSSMENS